MKNSSLRLIRDILSGKEVSEEIRANLVAEIDAEDAKKAEKAQANRNLYNSVHDVIMNAIPTDTPVTIAELYKAIAEELPSNFGRGKVQHAVTRMWNDEVVKHSDYKPTTYTRKV